MHIRWRFRSLLNFKHGDTFEVIDPGVGCPGRKGPNYSREVGDVMRREKACVLVRRPYRKPTQVDEERILRPTGEGLLRNSAN